MAALAGGSPLNLRGEKRGVIKEEHHLNENKGKKNFGA